MLRRSPQARVVSPPGPPETAFARAVDVLFRIKTYPRIQDPEVQEALQNAKQAAKSCKLLQLLQLLTPDV